MSSVALPYRVLDIEQRSAEWYKARAGRLTGSCAAAAISFKVKGGETEKRAALRQRLVCERIIGQSIDEDVFVTRELQRGVDLEPAACAAYEASSTAPVRWSGFLSHNELMVGCSLDGHVGDPLVGIIEIKCPKQTTHLGYIQDATVPEEYEPQALHNLWVSGAAWCDFISYDDRFPEALAMFQIRLWRNEDKVQDYATKAKAFLAEVDAAVDKVRELL